MRHRAALLALAVTLAACSSSNGPNGGGGGGGGGLTASNASPSSGNAMLDNPTVGHDTVAEGITGGIVIRAAQAVGSYDHEVSVYFDSTGAVETVQHQWTTRNPTSLAGLAMCSTSTVACDPAGVSVDVMTGSITLTALVLSDPGPGTTASTLDGTITY